VLTIQQPTMAAANAFCIADMLTTSAESDAPSPDTTSSNEFEFIDTQEAVEKDESTRLPSPETIDGGDGAAVNDDSKTRDFGIFFALSPATRDLFLYKNPMFSGAVLGTATVTYILIQVDFGVTLLYLWSTVGCYSLAGLLVATAMKQIYDKFTKDEVEPPLAKVLLEPHLKVLHDLVAPLLPSAEQLKVAAEALSTAAPTAWGTAVDIVCCTEMKKTTIWVLYLYVAGIVGSWFSVVTLAYLVVLVMFTAPMLYSQKRADIDHVCDLAQAKLSEAYGMVEDLLPKSKRD